MNTQLAVKNIQSRLPMPSGLTDLDAGKWRVLCESVFPSAKTAEAIVMAIDYCKARKLDPFKRPVNIVPMWNSTLQREVETVWPGINEVQVTASRTGKYAGMDEPKWGPDINRNFKGTRKYKDGNTWKEENIDLTISFPEWCSVTVYRLVDGQRCAFTEPVYWLEAYAHAGKTDAPNGMWAKRPRGQILKVAKAFSLRAAFPEEGEYTAEEMEGREIAAGGVVIDNQSTGSIMPYDIDPSKPVSIFKTNALRKSYQSNVENSLDKSVSLEGATYDQRIAHLNAIIELEKDKFVSLRTSGDERDQMVVDSIQNKYRAALVRLKTPDDEEEEIPAYLRNAKESGLLPKDGIQY